MRIIDITHKTNENTKIHQHTHDITKIHRQIFKIRKKTGKPNNRTRTEEQQGNKLKKGKT